MGITIDTFRHGFRRASAPTAAEADKLRRALNQADDYVFVRVVLCVRDGAVGWADCGLRPSRMYGERDVSRLVGSAPTGYLIIRCDQQRGMVYHGEAGRELRRQEELEAQEESYRDFCSLMGRLIHADEIRRRCCG